MKKSLSCDAIGRAACNLCQNLNIGKVGLEAVSRPNSDIVDWHHVNCVALRMANMA